MLEAVSTVSRVLTLCVLIGTLSLYVWLRHPSLYTGSASSGSQPTKAAWSILVGPHTQKGLKLTLRSLYDNVLIYHPRPVLLFYVRPAHCSPMVVRLASKRAALM